MVGWFRVGFTDEQGDGRVRDVEAASAPEALALVAAQLPACDVRYAWTLEFAVES